jgi:hypothetical protein
VNITSVRRLMIAGSAAAAVAFPLAKGSCWDAGHPQPWRPTARLLPPNQQGRWPLSLASGGTRRRCAGSMSTSPSFLARDSGPRPSRPARLTHDHPPPNPSNTSTNRNGNRRHDDASRNRSANRNADCYPASVNPIVSHPRRIDQNAQPGRRYAHAYERQHEQFRSPGHARTVAR